MRTYFNRINKCAGFTLIELILIIAIIIILGAIAVPEFGGVLNGVNEEIAVNKMMDDLRYAQNYALTNHTNTWFTADVANNSYSYGYYATAPFSDPQLVVDPATNTPSQVSLDIYPDIQITGETINNVLTFNTFGTPSDSASITINNNVVISISAETGYVSHN